MTKNSEPFLNKTVFGMWGPSLFIILVLALPVYPFVHLKFFEAASFFCSLSLCFIYISAYFQKYRKLNKNLFYSILCLFAFFLWYVFLIIIEDHKPAAIETLLELSLAILFFIMCSLKTWSNKDLKTLAYFFSFMGWFIFITWIFAPASNYAKGGFTSIFLNPNSLGIFQFAMIFFILLGYQLSEKWDALYFFVSLVTNLSLLIFTHARSVEMGLALTVFTYMIWNILQKNRILFSLYFLACVITAFSFIVFYMVSMQKFLSSTPGGYLNFFSELQQICMKFTGKVLDARFTVWQNALAHIWNNKWLGYGPGVIQETDTHVRLAPHNLYMLIALNSGFIGLLLFLIAMYFIWRLFNTRGQHPTKIEKLSGAFVIGIFIQQLFEVALTQTNLGLGLFFWLIIGIGISKTLGNRNEDSYPSRAK